MNEELMEQMLERENMREAWKRVKANKGAPGIDHISVEDFPKHIGPHWNNVRAKVASGKYNPAPARREEDENAHLAGRSARDGRLYGVVSHGDRGQPRSRHARQ